MKGGAQDVGRPVERAVLVGIDHGNARQDGHPAGIGADESLRELDRLARTAGVEPVATMHQNLRQITPATYIGKEATAAWSATKFTDGQATWSYELASNAASATLQVVDGAGNVVWTGEAPDRTTGVHDFSWDGDATSGNDGQEGQVYSLRVVAEDAAGGAIDSQILTRGRITGVEMYDGVPYLTVGNSILPLSTVIALEEARTAGTSTPPANDDEDQGLLASLASSLNPLKLFS